jgi:hypothetical protein
MISTAGSLSCSNLNLRASAAFQQGDRSSLELRYESRSVFVIKHLATLQERINGVRQREG